MRKLTTRSSWMDFRNILSDRESFTTNGALKGIANPDSVTLGKLPNEWHASASKASYVVYSYRTPIAWLGDGGVWITPDIRYSVTTTRHQSKVFTAISQIG